ncbi:unnamed protein product, partial [Mesorhabditis belari]|uniref:Spindle assembly abnormal protein 6 N-terminal domain-containing protein n=1 Tax=Mesorhabditis belari TaxID=2138241 RepID=A0AAF3FJ75_9BILA
MSLITEPSTASSYFLDETIPVTLITNGLGIINHVHLRVGERRLPNNDTEVRIEVSRPDDYRFVFANGITRESFAILRDRCNISTDFQSFAKRIVQLIKDRESSTPPLRIDCVIDTKDDTCSLELVSQLPVHISKIDITLRRVVGEELNYHLIDALSRIKEKHRVQFEQERKERKEFEIETKAVADCESKRLREEIERLKEKVSSLETDCRIEADEKETANGALEDIRKDLNDADQEIMELNEEQKFLLEEHDRVLKENERLKKDLKEALHDREIAEAKAEQQRNRAEENGRKLRESNRILKKTLEAVDEEGDENERIEDLVRDNTRKAEAIQTLTNELKKLTETYQQLRLKSEELLEENKQYRRREDTAKKMYGNLAPNRQIPTNHSSTQLVQASPFSFRQHQPAYTPASTNLPLGTFNAKQTTRQTLNPLLATSFHPTGTIETPLRNSPQQQILAKFRGTEAKENQIPGPSGISKQK